MSLTSKRGRVSKTIAVPAALRSFTNPVAVMLVMLLFSSANANKHDTSGWTIGETKLEVNTSALENSRSEKFKTKGTWCSATYQGGCDKNGTMSHRAIPDHIAVTYDDDREIPRDSIVRLKSGMVAHSLQNVKAFIRGPGYASTAEALILQRNDEGREPLRFRTPMAPPSNVMRQEMIRMNLIMNSRPPTPATAGSRKSRVRSPTPSPGPRQRRRRLGALPAHGTGEVYAHRRLLPLTGHRRRQF